MKKQAILLLSALTLSFALSGCGGNHTATPPDTDASPSIQSNPSNTVSPEPDGAQAVNTQKPQDSQSALTVFKSDYGYSISYEEESFDYRRTEGYDEFVLKSDEVEKPFVFVCISRIGAEFVKATTSASLGTAPESCKIGQADAKYAETEETWGGGNVIRKNYIYPLESGDALLIETQWYTESEDNYYAELLWKMVSGITV